MQWIPGDVERCGDCTGESIAKGLEDPVPVIRERLSNQLGGARDSFIHLLQWLVVGRLGFLSGFEQQKRQLHPPDAVRQRVVDLHHEGRLSAPEVLNEGELPQRS